MFSSFAHAIMHNPARPHIRPYNPSEEIPPTYPSRSPTCRPPATKSLVGPLPPCLHSKTLSRIFQLRSLAQSSRTCNSPASFKERGALNKLLSLTAADKARCDRHERQQSRAGRRHHAGRWAFGDHRDAAYTPFVKVRNTEGHGAKGGAARQHLAEDLAARARLAAKHKFVFVHPVRRSLHHRRSGHAGAGNAGGRTGPRHTGHSGRRRRFRCRLRGGGARRAPGHRDHRRQVHHLPAMAQRLRDEPVRVGTETIAEGWRYAISAKSRSPSRGHW